MKQYIGTKVVSAEPAYKAIDPEGNVVILTGTDNAELTSEGTLERGYRVVYEDGYSSFSPKAVFEKAYLPVNVNENLTGGGPSIGQKMVDDFITETHVMTLGEKTTVVRSVLRNGFEIVEASACVSKENYSEDMGRDICMEKIKDKVWMLLGFMLQTGVNGIEAPDTAK